jgi:hypothetical protein
MKAAQGSAGSYAQLALTKPDTLQQMADPSQAQAEPEPEPAAAEAVAPGALELRHLRYFVALTDAGTFTRAA